MSEIHGRMPVIIRPKNCTTWIDTNLTDVTKIQAMAQPYPERFMEAYPINRKVNSAKNDSPDLIEPILD
jgi:putative SOS response-associated peptidase YedK